MTLCVQHLFLELHLCGETSDTLGSRMTGVSFSSIVSDFDAPSLVLLVFSSTVALLVSTAAVWW